ncbi:MAG: manganese/zinc/iron transport system permease protein [Candidatus Marinamargulisbacteria bacterium]|jgi:manganese/zinc/iron transport system permease protein
MTPQIEIILIATVVSIACAIPGVFLVLRGVALMSDAISHSILLGIVVTFFMIKTLESPLLIIGAALAGLLTVMLTEWVIKTKRLKKDAAIGLIFPVFFSIGVILISKFAGNIHIDVDAVLLGELAFAPFNRVTLGAVDMGPYALWVMGVILAINVGLLGLFYKELKISTFDAGLAATLGFAPGFIHYGLMGVTSITAVGAFDAVGSILVVALMIAPPATAFLLTERLSRMIGLSMVFGFLSAILGYLLAHFLDASIAGAMATMSGVLFVGVLFFSPIDGLLFRLMRSRHQKVIFACHMLVVQLLGHENQENESQENTISNMIHHMGWSIDFAHQVASRSVQTGLIKRNRDHLILTGLGRETAMRVMVNP